MGGQLEYFGFWIDAEFGHGKAAPSCTTYNSRQSLAGKQEFTIDRLEVWAVGPEPEKEEESVLLIGYPHFLSFQVYRHFNNQMLIFKIFLCFSTFIFWIGNY